MAGWRLGLLSLGLFLAPLVVAIAGAAIIGRGPASQFGGAIAGLGLGLAGSVAMARILRRGPEKSP